MAENAAESVQKGQPMIVHGRLRVSSYEKDGQTRTSVEIEARSLGHDLTLGCLEVHEGWAERPARTAS